MGRRLRDHGLQLLQTSKGLLAGLGRQVQQDSLQTQMKVALNTFRRRFPPRERPSRVRQFPRWRAAPQAPVRTSTDGLSRSTRHPAGLCAEILPVSHRDTAADKVASPTVPGLMWRRTRRSQACARLESRQGCVAHPARKVNAADRRPRSARCGRVQSRTAPSAGQVRDCEDSGLTRPRRIRRRSRLRLHRPPQDDAYRRGLGRQGRQRISGVTGGIEFGPCRRYTQRLARP